MRWIYKRRTCAAKSLIGFHFFCRSCSSHRSSFFVFKCLCSVNISVFVTVTVLLCCDGSRIPFVVMAAAPEQACGDSPSAGCRREQQSGGEGAVAEPCRPTICGTLTLEPSPSQPFTPSTPVPSGTGSWKISSFGTSRGIIVVSVCGRAHARRICLQSKWPFYIDNWNYKRKTSWTASRLRTVRNW